MAMAYPEAVCLRKQMAEVLVGKEIADVSVEDVTKHAGNWRFGSIVQPPAEFHRRLLRGVVTGAESVANSVFLTTSTGYALVLGYLSGNVLYHQAGEALPKRSCMRVCFSDGSHLTVTISLWGLLRVLKADSRVRDEERQEYVTEWYGRAIEPDSKEYTWSGFRDAVAQTQDPKLSATKFLHAFGPGYYLSGIDSGYAIEILHRAGIHPKRRLVSLTLDEQKSCFRNVNTVAREAIRKGGRSSELDLYGRPGGFVPHVCKDTLGQPCRECGTAIEKFSFEGGSCYVCPGCQR